MASCLLAADVGNNASAYFDTFGSIEGNVSFVLNVGDGPTSTITQISQTKIQENVGGLQVEKLVGYVETGQLSCDYLSIRPTALAAPSIGTATLSSGTATVTTSASSAGSACLIFVTPSSNGTLTGTLRVSAQTDSDFTVTSTVNTDTCSFSWWIINPIYT